MNTWYACNIGGFSCGFAEDQKLPKPPTGAREGILQTEVPAGTWTSRFFADTDIGNIYLCHTLRPNVTVNFSIPGGNAISLFWSHYIMNVSKYWEVYIHDPSESVLLQSYAMEAQTRYQIAPKITNFPGHEDTDMQYKKKALILPRKMVLLEPSKKRPCNSSALYSRNMCNIRHSWKVRFAQMEAKYGKRFECQLPGVWVEQERSKPICTKFMKWGKNDTLGFLEVMTGEEDVSGHRLISLGAPPIGVHKEGSDCLARCSSYTYQLVDEQVTLYDNKMISSDLYLYFASTTVETWHEYRLTSRLGFLSEVGGVMGLVLGASFCSIAKLAIDGVTGALRAANRRRRI